MDDTGLVVFGVVFLLFAGLQWTFRNRKPEGSHGLQGTIGRGIGARPALTVAVLVAIGLILIVAGI